MLTVILQTSSACYFVSNVILWSERSLGPACHGSGYSARSLREPKAHKQLSAFTAVGRLHLTFMDSATYSQLHFQQFNYLGRTVLNPRGWDRTLYPGLHLRGRSCLCTHGQVLYLFQWDAFFLNYTKEHGLVGALPIHLYWEKRQRQCPSPWFESSSPQETLFSLTEAWSLPKTPAAVLFCPEWRNIPRRAQAKPSMGMMKWFWVEKISHGGRRWIKHKERLKQFAELWVRALGVPSPIKTHCHLYKIYTNGFKRRLVWATKPYLSEPGYKRLHRVQTLVFKRNRIKLRTPCVGCVSNSVAICQGEKSALIPCARECLRHFIMQLE